MSYAPDLPRGAEVVIVGGGIVGAATAFYAARAGLRPVLLKRRPALCSLTTAAAAGGFRLQQDNEEDLALVRESVDLFLRFAEVTGQSEYDPRPRAQGYLWVTSTEEGAGRQRRLVEAQRSWGLDDVELLSREEARDAFPYLDPAVVQARFRRGDGLIDPRALTFGLAAGSGAPVVLGCEVTGIRRGGGRLRVETGRGAVDADAVVVAAGPFSGRVAGLAGVELPVTTVARQKVVLPDVPRVPPDAPMTIDEDTGAHWRPSYRGASMLFTDPATPPTPPTEEVPVDHGFAFRLLDPASPVSVARVAPFWREVWEWGAASWMLQAGQYTMTPDRRPLIGQTPLAGVFVNTGYCGHGVMASPAGSRHLVDVVTGKVTAAENPYGLDRSFEPRPHLDPL
ncbi:MAG: NAD(P)/FAD-dependent oxidoreductase [Actinomycetota bacterium]